MNPSQIHQISAPTGWKKETSLRTQVSDRCLPLPPPPTKK